MMSKSLKQLAQPYFLQSDNNTTNTIVLLVHGFGASATETRPLAKYLITQGYDCYGLLLSGHGTNSKHLDNISWKYWILDIKKTYDKYVNNYKHIFIGGVSLGGSLSLYAAIKMNFDGLFTINAFYDLTPFQKLILPLLSLFKLHKKKSNERIDWYKKNNLFSYSDDSLFATNQIRKFHKVLHKKMHKIKVPSLIIQSQTDKTINPKNAEQIYQNLEITEKQLVKITEGDHILTVDKNRYVVFKTIRDFIANIAKK